MKNNHKLLLLAAVGLVPAGLAAQQLTLAGALARAATSGYANRTAQSEVAAVRAHALGALQGIVPSLRIEGGAARTTDPLSAFGFLLRQRAVTPAAFDPAGLNDPAARTNWNAAAIAEIPLFNADTWAGRRAGNAAVHAADANAGWIGVSTRLQVVQAYYNARLATEIVFTLQTAVATAEAHVRDVNSRLTQGMVTRSDLLLAQVRAGEIDAQLIGAKAEAQHAREQLALALGTPGDTAFSLPDSLPTVRRIRELAETLATATVGRAADAAAAAASADAARRDLGRATARLLPRVNAFARYDWNDSTAPARGNGSWTVGVQASWAPFSGFAELSDIRAARARAAAAGTMAEAAEAEAAMRRAAGERAVTVALARLQIAEDAVAQGSEAHRLVSRQYAGGLAGITDLLGAQASETTARLALAQARVALITAIAARQLARGADPAALAALEN